jgi:hypothetical protein
MPGAGLPSSVTVPWILIRRPVSGQRQLMRERQEGEEDKMSRCKEHQQSCMPCIISNDSRHTLGVEDAATAASRSPADLGLWFGRLRGRAFRARTSIP